MKYALITLILGFLAINFFDNYQNIIIPLGILFCLIFALYISSKRRESLKDSKSKLGVTFASIVFTMGLAFVLFYSVNTSWISQWYIPPILALLVFSRNILKWLINLGVKEPQSFGVMSETDRGETVRSKSEKKVADWLYANEIDYEYERKITLPDGSTILSDFYLVESDIFVEYWGMATADNETGEKYRARKEEKKILYEQYGYRLMDIYPHHLYELDNYIPQQIQILTGKKRGFFSWLKRLFGSKKEQPMARPMANSMKNQEDKPENESQQQVSEKAKLFCTNCGQEVAKLGDFCVGCGTEMTG